MLRILVVLLFALFVGPAAAQFMGPGSRHAVPTITVDQVAQLRPGTQVVLEGYILERRRSDYYLLRDNTGETLVEIDSHIWRRQPVDTSTRVRITGEVERGLFGRHVEARRLDIVR